MLEYGFCKCKQGFNTRMFKLKSDLKCAELYQNSYCEKDHQFILN